MFLAAVLVGSPSGAPIYLCENCGFQGIFFLIDFSELDDFRKELSEANNKDKI